MKSFFSFLIFGCTALTGYNASAQVAIHTGGSGDGYSGAIALSVHTGGAGDGYATAQITVPLPVHLLSFIAGKKNDRSVRIDWTAATDAHHDRFELERSYNGFNYTVLDVKKNANPGVDAKVSYTVIDELAVTEAPALPGRINVYYRLKSVDKDGSFKYAPVQRLVFDPAGAALINKVYPNPGNGIVYVETITTSTVAYKLFDTHGKTVAAGSFTGNTTLHFNHLSAGSYWLQAESHGKQELLRVDIVR